MHNNNQDLTHSYEEEDAESYFLENTVGPVIKVLMREERENNAF